MRQSMLPDKLDSNYIVAQRVEDTLSRRKTPKFYTEIPILRVSRSFVTSRRI